MSVISKKTPELDLLIECFKVQDRNHIGKVNRWNLSNTQLQLLSKSPAAQKALLAILDQGKRDGRITRREIRDYLTEGGKKRIDSDINALFQLDSANLDETIDIWSVLTKKNEDDYSYSPQSSFIEKCIYPQKILGRERTSLWQEEASSKPSKDAPIFTAINPQELESAYHSGTLLDYGLHVENPDESFDHELNQLEWDFLSYAETHDANKLQPTPLEISLQKTDPEAFTDIAWVRLVQSFFKERGGSATFRNGVSLKSLFSNRPELDCNTFALAAIHLLKLAGRNTDRLRTLILPGQAGHVVLVRNTTEGEVCLSIDKNGGLVVDGCSSYYTTAKKEFGCSPRENEELMPPWALMGTLQVDNAVRLGKSSNSNPAQVPELQKNIRNGQDQLRQLEQKRLEYEQLIEQTQQKSSPTEEKTKHHHYQNSEERKKFKNLVKLAEQATEVKDKAKFLQEAFHINPDDVSVRQNLADCYFQLSRKTVTYDQATDYLKKSVALTPNNPDYQKRLIEHCQDRLASIEQFSHQFSQDLKENQQDLAQRVSERTANTQQRIALYQNALTIMPQDASTHYNLATALMELDKLENTTAHRSEAETHLRTAIGVNKYFMEPLHQLGIILAETGRFDEALQCYQRYLNLYPDLSPHFINEKTIANGQGGIRHDLSSVYYNMTLINLQKVWKLEESKKGTPWTPAEIKQAEAIYQEADRLLETLKKLTLFGEDESRLEKNIQEGKAALQQRNTPATTNHE